MNCSNGALTLDATSALSVTLSAAGAGRVVAPSAHADASTAIRRTNFMWCTFSLEDGSGRGNDWIGRAQKGGLLPRLTRAQRFDHEHRDERRAEIQRSCELKDRHPAAGRVFDEIPEQNEQRGRPLRRVEKAVVRRCE